ncbi:hypothetical protein B296_00057494 [Ensete ventricosum]|uniref:Uncharacterized protein n=1 Tax=Ensete ventricosum TaxID=4639 RepID=A0A426WZH9_ENSVE|nr:hypothetical protein B296_00057494 [Ensete ventricosum]
MAETYGGRAAAPALGEGMARHATLMACGLDSVMFGYLHLGLQIDRLGMTWFPPKCRRGHPFGADLDESDRPIGRRSSPLAIAGDEVSAVVWESHVRRIRMRSDEWKPRKS